MHKHLGDLVTRDFYSSHSPVNPLTDRVFYLIFVYYYHYNINLGLYFYIDMLISSFNSCIALPNILYNYASICYHIF